MTADSFWKPGNEEPSVSSFHEKSEVTGFDGQNFVFNPLNSLPIIQQKIKLPVYKYKQMIQYLVENYQTLVLSGETGSGKSTQVVQYLHEAGWTNKKFMIAVSQPRRVSAISIATRVSQEMVETYNVESNFVGYSIRFQDSCVPEKTKIKFLTDGCLIKEIMADPLLNKYSVIVLDEVHERTVNTDFIIGSLKKILKKRPELRLVISSATMDTRLFLDFFNFNINQKDKESTSFSLVIEGRCYPVDVFYLQNPCPSYLESTIDSILKIHANESQGDVLAFLPGIDDIEYCFFKLRDYEDEKNQYGEGLVILTLYGGLPIYHQLKVFQKAPYGKRKVILSTNIAEASITIQGIVYVVDCGFTKLKVYDPNTGIESLMITTISKQSACQRTGRAGRVRSGKTFRLYTENDYSSLEDSTLPEIQRSNMSSVVLQLKSLGINNIISFPFLSPPSSISLADGVQLLYALGAINEEGQLVDPLGYVMSEFPLEPMSAKMLLTSGYFGCSMEAAIIASMIQIENIFLIPPNKKRLAENAKLKFSVKEGDHLTLLNVFLAYCKVHENVQNQWCRHHYLNANALKHAVYIKNHLISLLRKCNVPIISCNGDDIPIRKCLAAGFFANSAKYQLSGSYRTPRDQSLDLYLHPSSVLACERRMPKWIVYNQVISTSKLYMRDVTVIEPEWLIELAPHYYEQGTEREIIEKRKKKQ